MCTPCAPSCRPCPCAPAYVGSTPRIVMPLLTGGAGDPTFLYINFVTPAPLFPYEPQLTLSSTSGTVTTGAGAGGAATVTIWPPNPVVYLRGCKTAWLMPPVASGTPVTIKFMSVPMSMGKCGAPPVVSVTSQAAAAVGGTIPQGSPVVLTVSSGGATYYAGCTQNDDAILTWNTSSCAGGTVSPSQPLLTTNNSLQTMLMTGTACTAASSTGKQLRALPTAVPDEYVLAWRDYTDTNGINVTLSFVV